MKRIILMIGMLFVFAVMFAGTKSKAQVGNDGAISFSCPLKGEYKVSVGFGKRNDPVTESVFFHNGIDLMAESGTDVYSAEEGTVLMTGFNMNYGNFVIVGHRYGYQTVYAHLSEILVEVNDSVSGKTKIGLLGNTGISTGPNLHFAIAKDGKYIDPKEAVDF